MAAFAALDRRLAACLAEASPFAIPANRLLRSADALGRNRMASALRAWLVAHVFAETERILDAPAEPRERFAHLLESCAGLLHTMAETGFSGLGPEASADPAGTLDQATAEHYGRLFRDFSDRAYWDESRSLLSTRLERNGIDAGQFQDRSLLDAGCGGGRYSGAWRLLGARPVLGVDFSSVNIDTACRRAAAAGLDGLGFETGDVLDLPYREASFDAVFSNGVLHHTRDWRRGVAELLRVLKPGGFGWLYLIESPGGIFWDSIELLRAVMRDEDGAAAKAALSLLGLPAHRIFYMLDHVMAPINLRLTPEEVRQCLESCGAARIRRLTRGADFDRIERIHRGEPFAAEKVGVGENRFVFWKG